MIIIAIHTCDQRYLPHLLQQKFSQPRIAENRLWTLLNPLASSQFSLRKHLKGNSYDLLAVRYILQTLGK